MGRHGERAATLYYGDIIARADTNATIFFPSFSRQPAPMCWTVLTCQYRTSPESLTRGARTTFFLYHRALPERSSPPFSFSVTLAWPSRLRLAAKPRDNVTYAFLGATAIRQDTKRNRLRVAVLVELPLEYDPARRGCSITWTDGIAKPKAPTRSRMQPVPPTGGGPRRANASQIRPTARAPPPQAVEHPPWRCHSGRATLPNSPEPCLP